jgi:hypothetical protein
MNPNSAARRIRVTAYRIAAGMRFRLGGSPTLRRNAQRLLKAASAGVGYAAILEPSLLETTLVEVAISDLAPELDGYQIVHLSDVHYNITAGARFLRRVVEKANALDADMVALTGDFIALNPQNLDRCFAVLSDLKAPDGCWVVRGNHDYKASLTAMQGACRAAGMRLLENQHAVVRPHRQRGALGGALHSASALTIAGVGDIWEGLCLPGKALAGAPPGQPTILLSHNPQVVSILPPSNRVDLVLSGHTHGGQVRPMGRPIRLLADGNGEFVSGLVRSGRAPVYISRGVGTSSLRLRWNCRPEIVLVRLVRA